MKAKSGSKHKPGHRTLKIVVIIVLAGAAGLAIKFIPGIIKESAVHNTQVLLKTNFGDIAVELDEQKAPVTTANFLKYIKQGHYDGTIFHRVIPNFMIQGGGFAVDGQQKKPGPPITNEAGNGLKNMRGTIAMARTNDPDSATCQFFINLVDNGFLDYSAGRNPGYAVFGRVVEGMETVDKIGAVKTGAAAGMKDVPVQPVIIESVKVVGTLVDGIQGQAGDGGQNKR